MYVDIYLQLALQLAHSTWYTAPAPVVGRETDYDYGNFLPTLQGLHVQIRQIIHEGKKIRRLANLQGYFTRTPRPQKTEHTHGIWRPAIVQGPNVYAIFRIIRLQRLWYRTCIQTDTGKLTARHQSHQHVTPNATFPRHHPSA